MNKRVYNKTVGKIFRTLGFLLILVVSAIITAEMITSGTISFLAFAEPIATQVADLIPAIVYEYLGLGLLVGLLFLVWAIRRGVVLRFLVTVVLLAVFVIESYTAISFFTDNNLLTPAWLVSALAAISGPIDQLLDISIWIAPGAALAAVILLWAVFANARPKRFSIFFIRLSTITLMFAIIMLGIKSNVSGAFTTADWYLMIMNVCYFLSFALITFGSVFGVIGFYRK